MSLTKCPECGNEVSDKAVACPKCGCPLHSAFDATTTQNVNNVKQTECQNASGNAPSNSYRAVQPQPNSTQNNKSSQKPPLSERTWFLVVMCLCFPPIGVALLWIKKRPKNMVLRVIITVYLGIVTIYTFININDESSDSQKSEQASYIEEAANISTIEAESKAKIDDVNSIEDASDSGSTQKTDKAYEIIEKPSEDVILTLSRRALHNEMNDLEDKWVRTAGEITAINTNEDNNTFINMKGKSDLKMIHFYLMYDQDTSNLEEGSYITIVGRVAGKIIGQAIVENCYIESIGDVAKELDESLIANDGISGGDSFFGTSEINKDEAILVTATEVYKELSDNQVACKNKYDGKVVALTGKIDDIGTNIYGQEYVSFDTGDKYSLTGVQCFFKDDQMDYVASLKKGDTITIYGIASIGSMTFKVSDCRP
ncbi:tRNA(Ser,Leu) C12 N-acetylase TAN1, contains THUMP domain [Butyrivibrio proteoclasticus]|uniref:tRNA(Ser,Leu) C12 N-acetylase TAN1, contains THUMP domain n=1 Tax=Butyrivibrio proteoclasticus TaxID=43305 RepID=A0A1I5VBN9_9FIRM|nr:zinc-ribbon domain-containing protein [Butyrivibrio proteoclasticus]SFQ04757.1 tRNA(Ser,Leu) C12 N-acetylase TAN1, contains THUMP domain [Butyrivibrio proteoclasticus]